MPNSIKNIVEHINRLQDELEQAISERAEKFSYTLQNQRVRFSLDTIKQHKQFKTGLWRYITGAQILTILTAPFIYSLIIAFVILDIMVSLYQAICFPVYKIPKVKRKDYIIVDRHHLGYLNLLEKLNCLYCSYGNGLMAYVSEIASRTEAFWCPIKHAGKQGAYHKWYGDFSDYGDAENYTQDRNRNIASVREDADVPNSTEPLD